MNTVRYAIMISCLLDMKLENMKYIPKRKRILLKIHKYMKGIMNILQFIILHITHLINLN